jgi:hypothetical protein
MGKGSWGGLIHVHRQDLMDLAAQCLGAVADMDELNTTKK